MINQLIADYPRLIASPKSSDCSSGYRLTQLLVRHFLEATVSQLSNNGTIAPELDPSISMINCLLDILESHVAQSTLNLMKASVTTPMYGVVQALRAVIDELGNKYILYKY